MSKKGAKTTTVHRIRELSRTRKSANEIVRQTRREGIGIRRKTILTYIRGFRGKAPKKDVYKYIPRKYRIRERRIPFEHEVKQKHVSVYGKQKGINKRYEISGTGHEIMDFLRDAVFHPPRRRIARIRANRISDRKEVDYGKVWDSRPKIES